MIELDGAQHGTKEGLERDDIRSAFLAEYGLEVIHIQNKDVRQNFEGVCGYIDAEVKQSLSQLR